MERPKVELMDKDFLDIFLVIVPDNIPSEDRSIS